MSATSSEYQRAVETTTFRLGAQSCQRLASRRDDAVDQRNGSPLFLRERHLPRAVTSPEEPRGLFARPQEDGSARRDLR